MQRAYLVTSDGKVSQEAYSNIQNAKDFIKSRTLGRNPIVNQNGWRTTYIINGKTHTYEILEVTIR